MIYLASPYSHKDPTQKEKRFEDVARLAAALMQKGKIVFCPITHSRPIEKYLEPTNDTHGFWLTQDFAVLQKCDNVFVAKLEGWQQSMGVQAELAMARTLGIPIAYVNPETAEVDNWENNVESYW